MSAGGFDPEILNDFLTECGELLETLESDLVGLEQDSDNFDLINRVFRALHTIKGSASFLALTNLVKIAHAAESALNAARNRVITVDRALMDRLLQAVDLIKCQMGQIRAGEALSEPSEALVSELSAMGEGQKVGETKPEPAKAQTTTVSGGRVVRELQLPAGKADLLEFLIADIDETITKIGACVGGMKSGAQRVEKSPEMLTLSEELGKAVAFFEFESFTKLADALREGAELSPGLDDECAAQAMPRLEAVCLVLAEQCAALKRNQVMDVPTGKLLERLHQALTGRALADGALKEGSTGAEALAGDTTIETGGREGVNASITSPPEGAKEAAKAVTKGEESQTKQAANAESTIRVEVGRLEALMNLVGELVLQKNRVNAIARKLGGEQELATEMLEAVSLAAGGLDRVTADIQAAVMRTRMQPLDRLFSKYPRLIRDLSSKTGKKMQLAIEGGDTEVDKSVIEELGDPLVHLLRNSADHGLESAEDRVRAGKGDTGTITLRACHEGSQVKLQIIDDGRGLARERIAGKAIERGLATAEQISGMSDREVYRFIFEPGFSTAEKVSDLSGRGVGMDVVRTNIEKLKGTIDLASTTGSGTTITITIPLTVAILPAMMVGVREEVFAVPLTNILEIVKPDRAQLYTIGERPVMRLRDSVLPLIDGAAAFGLDRSKREDAPFAVVITMNDQRVGLMVSKLIGQQEVVIKPLDEQSARRRTMVSGATVRDDGGVSLIVDVAELVRSAEGVKTAA
jgi:two-component system chemotaxis sensor kinase CheA